MSEPEPPAGDVDVEETPQAEPAAEGYAPSVAARLAMYQRAGGIITPLVTALFAFLVGGLVVLATTGKNPLSTYRAIFNGTGLNWLFPWVSGAERHHAALNLQQTLIVMVPLILTSLAVAFAFRCGLFNIGGQGQYTVGTLRCRERRTSWSQSFSLRSREPPGRVSRGYSAQPSARTR